MRHCRNRHTLEIYIHHAAMQSNNAAECSNNGHARHNTSQSVYQKQFKQNLSHMLAVGTFSVPQVQCRQDAQHKAKAAPLTSHRRPCRSTVVGGASHVIY